MQPDGRTSIRAAEAKFNGPVAGAVHFLWLGSSGDTDSAIYVDLYHTHKLARPTQHKWKIFTTDVLDSEAGIYLKMMTYNFYIKSIVIKIIF